MNSGFGFFRKFKFAEIILSILVLFSGILLGFSSGGFVLNFNRIGFSIVSTVQKGVFTVANGAKKTVLAVRDLSQLQKEYLLLTEKLKDYENMQRSNVEVRKENQRLRELLEFTTNFDYKNTAAQIIGRDPDNLYSGVTINKGVRNGIKKGMPVIAIQNGNVGIVGKVVSVGIETSMVMPIYDTKCNISARLQNTRDIGIISGKGSYSMPLSLQYIRKRVAGELAIGDVVVTSGENDNYMKDIPIGRISKFEVLDYESSLSIEITPIIDFLRLENVVVVDQTKKGSKQ